MSERSDRDRAEGVREAAVFYAAASAERQPDSVPAGYKRTEVGVIPEDWDQVRVSTLAKVRGGKRLPKGYSLIESPTPHPYIRVADMQPGKVDGANVKFVPEKAFHAIKNYRIYKDDIFISVAGTLGMVGTIPNYLDGACLTENADRITDINCNRYYLMYWLMSEPIQRVIDSIRTVGAQPKLALGRIAKFDIAIPPDPEEQAAIAKALSDADALIESLDRLIAKKRAIKQGAMQQLLTGQTRLPGFTGEWEAKRLEEIGVFYKGQGIRRDDVSEEGVPCIRYGEIYTRYDNYVTNPESRIPRNIALSAFPLKTGDILFAGSGETAEEIGMCLAYLGESSAFAGGDIVILRPHYGISAYLGHLLNHPSIAQQKARLGQGDAVVHISARNLAQIELRLPRADEQTAIASVLSDMDAEIEALEHRRDKARQIKQGMMQALLTGRTRLVEPEAYP
ncbi:restriction endonuclease subunit S [uncultured Kushneria sp.]|uniref:restriction endonuclease subunit S n=1 Tax=uncultured Kushneria sp. TaxID=905033 RepID=UPI0026266A0E|nr:restriction endonuclease subunit S [uncultured Kushneria sp.]